MQFDDAGILISRLKCSMETPQHTFAELSTGKGRKDVASCTRLPETDQNIKSDHILTSLFY